MKTQKAMALLGGVVLIWGVNWTVTMFIVSVMQVMWATVIRAGIAVLALLTNKKAVNLTAFLLSRPLKIF